MVKIHDGMVELEEGLVVREVTWKAFQTLADLPEVGVPFMSRMFKTLGSYQEAARWMDTHQDKSGTTPADWIVNFNSQSEAEKMLKEYHP